MKALFIGRFQPVHNGHVHAIKQALHDYEFATIGVGSANKANAKKNPFSYEERKRMLELALAGVPKSKYFVFPVPDFFDDKQWSEYVCKHARFDAVVTGSNWVRRCLQGKAKIVSPHYLDRRAYNATNVRKKMLSGKSFSKLVPKKVFAHLKKISASERLKKIYSR